MIRFVAPIVFAIGCRLNIEDVPRTDGGAGTDDSDIDAPILRPVQVTIVGRGAVSGPSGICASECTLDGGLGDLTLTAYGAVTWSLAPSSMCAGTTCTVPDGVDAITITFVQTVPQANRVFITSTEASTTAGRAAFDTLCQNLATQANLSGTFVAFISTSTQIARDRLSGARGWIRMDGLPVLDQPTDIGSPNLPRSILFDETGAPRPSLNVVSGSSETGELNDTCADWTTVSGTQMSLGMSSAGAEWMLGGWAGGCLATAPTFCMQTDKNIAVDVNGPAFPIGRRIFVSVATLTTAGADSADQVCQTEADAAGLGGTFRALLATSTQSAAARFGSLAGPWRRTDNVLVTLGALDAGRFDAAILRNAMGTLHSASVNFGANDFHTPALLTENCNDWTLLDSSYIPIVSPKFIGLFDDPLAGSCGNQSLLCAEL